MASITKSLNNFIKKNESINNYYIKPRKIKTISEEEFNKHLKQFIFKYIKSLPPQILDYKFTILYYIIQKKN